VFFFELTTWLLLVLLFVVIVGATVIGLLTGRAVRHRSEDLREPFSVMQAALLGFMGLVLAFGLAWLLGVTRRAAPRSSTRATRSARPTFGRKPSPNPSGAIHSPCSGSSPTRASTFPRRYPAVRPRPGP
jgi:lysylphosphatidylglycerol synthetase-like protein (DUF2156 family)